MQKNKKKWKLAWSDEFDGGKLDETKWTRCARGASDWDNTMSDDPDLLRIANSVMQLRGVENKNTATDASPYLTAGVTSKGKFSFKHGKAEIRARFKSARGAWPALWMLGADGSWPSSGEIDIMEHLNFDDKVYQTIHSEYTLKIDKTNTPPKGATAKIDRDGWNNYGCEWDGERIVLSVNGIQAHTYPRVAEKGAEQWPFDRAFYFIFSMQVGGNWVNGPGPTEPADYPAWMEIDWVRVFAEDKQAKSK